MSENVIRVPLLKLGIPKPKKWDLVAIAVILVSTALAVLNLVNALGGAPGASVSGTFTTAMVLAQGALTSAALFVLGKTAKEGTIWGNLAAVTGMLVGTGGILIATALWAAA